MMAEGSEDGIKEREREREREKEGGEKAKEKEKDLFRWWTIDLIVNLFYHFEHQVS
jgi:hypothetical protein